MAKTHRPATQTARTLALAGLCTTALLSQARAETLSSNWTASGAPDTGVIFLADGSNPFYLIFTPLVTLSQVVTLAAGQYRMEYRGDALVSDSGSPTTLTPTISTATAPGTTLTSEGSGVANDLVSIISQVPTAVHSDVYTITAPGAATVTFTFATEGCTLDPGLTFCAANFDFDSVVLTLLSLSPLAGLLPADSPQNALNVIAEIDPFAANALTLPPEFAALYALAPEDQVDALLLVSGELATGVQQSRIQADDAFLRTMFAANDGNQPRTDALAFVAGQDGGALPGLDDGWRFWGSFDGGSTRLSGDAATGASDLSADHVGLALGGTLQLSDVTSVGFALGLTRSTFAVTGGAGAADLFHLGLTLRQDWDRAYLVGGLVATTGGTETTRIAGVAGDALVADFDAPSVMARIEAGLDVTAAGASITPFAAYQASALFVPAYGETAGTGDGSLALDYDARTIRTSRAELGLRWNRITELAAGTNRLTASFALVHHLNTDRLVTAGFQALPGTGFEVAGADGSQNAVIMAIDNTFTNRNGWVTSANLTGEVGDNSQSWSAGLKVDFRF